MRYILVMGLTLILAWSIIKISNKKSIKFLTKIKYSQSAIHEIVKDFIPKEMFDKPKVMRQSQKHAQKNMLKVVITEGKAYWTLDNVFYTAKSINGRVDESTIKPLEMENMSKKELEKMLSILDDLNGKMDSNDSGSAGYNGV